MTRIVACGDSQFGVATVTLESQERVWDQIVTAAIENGADALLHGGDLFEHATPTADVLAAFRRPLARLREAGIPMLLIRGNHDGAMKPVDAVDVFHEYPGLQVVQRPDNIEVAGVTVSCLPWTPPARMVANRNGGDRDRINEDVAGMLVGLAARMHAIAPKDKPNVLLCHWSISGASLPTGLPVDQLREPVIEWADLDAIGLDAVIAAHIHKGQRLDNPNVGDTTPGVYVGSPQMLSHGESGYAHGVWLLDVEPGAVLLEFLEIQAPRFETVDLDEEWLRLAQGQVARGETVEWSNLDDAIVRVRYTATREQDATIDKDAIRRELLAAGASRVTIEPKITREVRARDERITQELSDLDALALYLEAQRVAAPTAEQVMERFRKLLA